MKSITIVLPLPNRVLLPNRARSAHWGTKGKAVEKARFDGHMAAMHAMNEQGQFYDRAPTIRFLWVSRTKTRPDPDAVIASAKAAIDGICDAGLFRNDKYLIMGGVEFAIDKIDPRLEITLESAT